MFNNRIKNTPINLDEDSVSENLDLERIHFIANLPLDEVSKACKLSCIENNTFNYDKNTNEFEQSSFIDEDHKDLYNHSPLNSQTKNTTSSIETTVTNVSEPPKPPPSSPLYNRSLRTRRAIQLQPFTMEHKMYWNTFGRYVRDGSKPTGSKQLISDISKSKGKGKGKGKHQQQSESPFNSLQSTSFSFGDQYNHDYSSDSSYNDVNGTMDVSDNDDSIINMESDEDKRSYSTKHKRVYMDDDNDDTDIEDILNGITKSVDAKQKSTLSVARKKNKSSYKSNKKEKRTVTVPTKFEDDGDDTDIEDILNIREKSPIRDKNNNFENKTVNNTNNINNIDSININNEKLNGYGDDDEDDDESIVHISKRRRLIMESDSDDYDIDGDQDKVHDQESQNVHKKGATHDIFDFSQFEQSSNQLYIPNRHLHNKNLVTYKPSQSKWYSKQKQKAVGGMKNKKDKVNDIFEFPSEDILEIDNDNNNNKSNTPKRTMNSNLVTTNPSAFLSPSTTITTSSIRPRHIHHTNQNDDFIIQEDNEHAERRRNVTLKELRKTKKALKGILPLSFTKVFRQELDEEESDQSKRSYGANSTRTPFRISHDNDNDVDSYANSVTRNNSSIMHPTTNKAFDDFADFYDDDNNNSNNSSNITAINDDSHYNNNNSYDLFDIGDNDETSTANKNNSNNLPSMNTLLQTQTKIENISDIRTNSDYHHHHLSTDDIIITATQKECLSSTSDIKVPTLPTGSIFADNLRYFSNNKYSMFEDGPTQFLSEYEMLYGKSFTPNNYTAKSSLVIALFYQAFQSFYIIWTNGENDSSHKNTSIPNQYNLPKTKMINDFILFLRFVTKCLIGYDNNMDNDDNHNMHKMDDKRKEILYFMCKEMDILLSRLFIIVLWNDNIKTNTYERITEQKNINQKQQCLLLVVLFFRLEWAFQLNKLNTTAGFDDYKAFSTLSLRTAIQSLLWHLFSMGPSASSIKPPSSSSIIHVVNPMVVEIWIHLLNIVKKEKLETLMWSTLQMHVILSFPLTKGKNNPSVKDMLLLGEKSSLIWFWLLTILILIRLERDSNGIYILKGPENNPKLQSWNVIHPILNEYRINRPNFTHLNQYQLLHVLKTIRYNFYQCHFLISQYNWPWDNKLIELLFTLIEWQSLQLYTGDDHTSTYTHFLNIKTDTASGYFPSFLINYNGHIPDDTIEAADSCGIIFLKIISFGLSRHVSYIINHSATLTLSENEKALEQLKQYISRMSSSYSIVVAASNTSTSEFLHQMFSYNRQRFLDPNYEDPFISFAFHYTINIIILHCICRLNIHDLIHSVTERSITIQSKVHTETAWASDIKNVALNIYHKIKKYWKIHS